VLAWSEAVCVVGSGGMKRPAHRLMREENGEDLTETALLLLALGCALVSVIDNLASGLECAVSFLGSMIAR